MVAIPSLEFDVICLMPLIVLRAFSTGLATCSATLSGPAPGYVSVTATTGTEMSGRRFTGRLR